jgi:hypothetical protein
MGLLMGYRSLPILAVRAVSSRLSSLRPGPASHFLNSVMLFTSTLFHDIRRIEFYLCFFHVGTCQAVRPTVLTAS